MMWSMTSIFMSWPAADYIAGDFDVGIGWRGVAAGMVVDNDDAGGVGYDGGFKDFAGMDEEGVQGALAENLPADEFAPGVQVDDDEVFHVGPEDDAAGELLEEVGRQNFRGVHGDVAHGCVGQAHDCGIHCRGAWCARQKPKPKFGLLFRPPLWPTNGGHAGAMGSGRSSGRRSASVCSKRGGVVIKC